MLTLNNITCEKGGRVLFENLGFTVGDCCLVAIRGANGCGKTTLLNVIAGLQKPAKGQILYANEDVLGEHYEEYCSIIQYIGHKNSMKPYLTVEENMNYWASLRGNEVVVPAAMRYFALDYVKDVLFSRLSAGWKRRVALSRLMLWKSEIWLLDEPFTNLDEETKTKTAGLITARLEQGGSVIIATHENIPVDNVREINLEEFRT